MITFTKMHGCGNDYIYINCSQNNIENPNDLVVQISDRNKGIGGDGLVLILPSEIADAKMRMFNADGSEGNMCGNAIRCVGKYLYDNKLVDKTHISIETKSGIKELCLFVEDGVVHSVKVDMGPAKVTSANNLIICVSMGNPHAVIFDKNIDSLNLSELGPFFEKNPYFSNGVNTEFVQVVERNHLKMRVWERGSGETLACGTGACAAAVAAVLCGHCDKNTDIQVDLKGGSLIINYTDEAVYMTGGATRVFDGVIDL